MDDAVSRYRAFVRAADLGSFSKAALELGFSQSALSRAIAALEAECGLRLLERSRAGVCLTAEGTALLPQARALVAAQDEFSARVDAVAGLEAGHVRIGAFSSVATHWLPHVIERFHENFPRITYEVLLGDYDEIEGWVASGRVDCGFVRLPVRARGLRAVFIEDDELMAVVPRDHALASLAAVPAAALKEEPFLLLEKDGNVVVDEAFARCGGVPQPAFTTWDDYAIMAMVEAGLGVAVLPSLILRRIPYDVAVRPLAESVFRKIGLTMPAAARTPRALERFLEYLPCRDGLSPASVHVGAAG